MTVYYIDSVNGSDSNAGTSTGAAFASVSVVANLKLRPGDSVLLSRGSVFTDTLTIAKSGAVGNPITIGAYGHGDAPKLSGTVGIVGTGTANIVIHDVAIANNGGAAIYGLNVRNWDIHDIAISDTGAQTGIGGIVFKNANNVAIANSTFKNIEGDGVFISIANGVTVKDSSFTHINGHAADAIQIETGSNLVFDGNTIDMTTSRDSTKGGIVTNFVQDVTFSDNVVTGGSFGFSVSGQNVTIEGNTLTAQTKYDWSAGVLIGGPQDISNYNITKNVISDSRWGVAITGQTATNVRTDMNVTDNVFVSIEKSALKVDRPTTGTFADNIVINSQVSTIKGLGATLGYQVAGNNEALTITEAIAQKVMPGHVDAPVEHTNVNVTPIIVIPETQAPSPIVVAPETVQHVDANPAPAQAAAVGQAPAAVVTEPEPVASQPTAPTPTPSPVASAVVETPIVVQPAVAPPTKVATTRATNIAPQAANDKISLLAGATKISGNVLTNDFDANGDTLWVRTAENKAIAKGGSVDLAGLYGTLHISENGDYTYTLSNAGYTAIKGNAKAVDKFAYKMADTYSTGVAKLIVDLSDMALHHDADMLVI